MKRMFGTCRKHGHGQIVWRNDSWHCVACRREVKRKILAEMTPEDFQSMEDSYFEYPDVRAQSSNVERLMRLHRTQCTELEARKIIEWLLRLWPIYTGRSVQLRLHFTGIRGRASFIHRRQIAWISLPANTRLRVGLVLHEYAHHLAGLGEKHSLRFVQTLDLLCEDFEAGRQPTSSAAGPSMEDVCRTYVKRSRCRGCRITTTRKHSVDGGPCCRRCEEAGR